MTGGTRANIQGDAMPRASDILARFYTVLSFLSSNPYTVYLLLNLSLELIQIQSVTQILAQVRLALVQIPLYPSQCACCC